MIRNYWGERMAFLSAARDEIFIVRRAALCLIPQRESLSFRAAGSESIESQIYKYDVPAALRAIASIPRIPI
jgi:hypothetical protein